MSATKVSISVGQQLGLSYLYNVAEWSINPTAMGRTEYVRSRAYAENHFSDWAQYRPFGNNVATSGYIPGQIAIWQAFAQHFGHVITDRLYGIGADYFDLQGTRWTSDATQSSDMKYLENFNPQIGAPLDYFYWIPVGLINDLIDSNVDATAVIDNVSGFTYNDIQYALTFKPALVSDFKNQLKVIKPAQATQIDQLFASYGY